MVIEVQAPSPASTKSYGPGPVSSPPAATGSSASIRCGPIETVCWNLLSRVSRTTTLRGASPGSAACSERDGIEIARGPGGDDVGDIGGIAPFAQQMIRAGQRDKTLGMLGGDEDARGVVDADGVVGRRMHDQQRLVQVGHMRHQAVLGDVVEEFARDVERPAGERDLDLAVLADVLDAILEQAR